MRSNLLFVLLFLSLYRPLDCRQVLATRHEAWESVFYHFPERQRGDVDGYIATDDCNEMGKTYLLSTGKEVFFVAVADCRNRQLPRRQGQEQVDIADWLWWEADLPNRPTPVYLCEVPSIL